jgi:hypothetical protein
MGRKGSIIHLRSMGETALPVQKNITVPIIHAGIREAGTMG